MAADPVWCIHAECNGWRAFVALGDGRGHANGCANAGWILSVAGIDSMWCLQVFLWPRCRGKSRMVFLVIQEHDNG